MTTVAVLGTGRMGGAMAGTLRRAGFDLMLWNRTASTAQALGRELQAEVAPTAGAAAAGAGVVLSSLADDRAVRDVYVGGGVAASVRKGTVVCEMSTIAPETVLKLQPLLRSRGAALLDAPVSGSVSLVEKGELTVMVGGDAGDLERARPVLDALAAKVFHVGGQGAGATMKLAVNALVHGVDVALSEALVLAEAAGVARSVAYDVFAAGAGAAPFVLYKRAAFERPDEVAVAFSLELMEKDLDLILALADRAGVSMDQARTNRATARAAIQAGWGSRDMSALAEFLRRAGPS